VINNEENCTLSNLHQLNDKNEIVFESPQTDAIKIVITNSSIPQLPQNLMRTFPNLQIIIAKSINLKMILPTSFNVPGTSKLTQLILSHNKIEKINKSTFVTTQNLVHLDLSHNKISQIKPEGFFDLISLSSLDLSNNQITKLGQNTFSKMDSLQWLNFTNNQIKTIDLDCFENKTKLTTILLSHNRIAEIKPKKTNNFLRSLDVSSNELHTFTNISQFESLESLDVSDNQNLKFDFTEESGWPSNLTKLRLNKIKLDQNDQLLESFSSLDELTELCLDDNAIDNFNKLKGIQNLQHLSVYGNQVSMFNYWSITENFPNLIFLNISNNKWECSYLELMLMELKKENISYTSEDITEFNRTETSLDGITCSRFNHSFVSGLLKQLEDFNIKENNHIIMLWVGGVVGALIISGLIITIILMYFKYKSLAKNSVVESISTHSFQMYTDKVRPTKIVQNMKEIVYDIPKNVLSNASALNGEYSTTFDSITKRSSNREHHSKYSTYSVPYEAEVIVQVDENENASKYVDMSGGNEDSDNTYCTIDEANTMRIDDIKLNRQSDKFNQKE
jgi:Leucine-rich repeat (LRR) protein